MKNFAKTIAGVVAGVALAAGLAFAANTYYAGYNPQTNANGVTGLVVSGGALPVVTQGGGTCTGIAVAGGTSAGTITVTTSSSCVLTVTLPVPSIVVSSGNNDGKNATNSAAAPTGIVCTFTDTSNSGAVIASTGAVSTTVCTSGAVASGHVISYVIQGF